MNNLLGKYGGVELRSLMITNERGETRPASRVTPKIAKAIPILMSNIEIDNGICCVDISVTGYSQIYAVMARLGYAWYGDEWKRHVTNFKWVKVTK